MITLVELSLCGGSILKRVLGWLLMMPCVMGANQTMKRLKHIVRATMATMESLPLMRISLFELTFEVTFETRHR